ncbi:pre-rRNA-processing protein TSR2 homolog [Clavelina lepadiformis]|uniref:pre-rRNA-processing protein TSR2 homolog n=1 Tax=Clavelina lepadiformis TaxID=159417 RepID=UPI00404339EB
MNNSEASYFYTGIQAVLKSWTALQLAISHSFAGPYSNEKAQWLVGVIETFFKENADIDPIDLEDFIGEIMSNEFNTLIEDDSLKNVASKICHLYSFWSKGKINEMKEHINKLPCVNLGDCMSVDTKNSVSHQNDEDQKILDGLNICSATSRAEHSENGHDLKLGSGESNYVNNDSDEGWTQVITRRKRH